MRLQIVQKMKENVSSFQEPGLKCNTLALRPLFNVCSLRQVLKGNVEVKDAILSHLSDFDLSRCLAVNLQSLSSIRASVDALAHETRDEVSLFQTSVEEDHNLEANIEIHNFDASTMKVEPQFHMSCTESGGSQDCKPHFQSDEVEEANKEEVCVRYSSAQLLRMFRRYTCLVNKHLWKGKRFSQNMCVTSGPKIISCPECEKMYVFPLESLPKLGMHIVQKHKQNKEKLLTLIQKKYDAFIAHMEADLKEYH